MLRNTHSLVLAMLALGLAGAPGTSRAEQNVYVATSDNRALSVYVSGDLIQSTFAIYCSTATCADFDRYDVTIGIEQGRPIIISFIPMRSASEEYDTFICELLSSGTTCGSTRQPAH